MLLARESIESLGYYCVHVCDEEEDERHKSGQYESPLVVVILDIFLFMTGPLFFFPFSGSEAYLLFNSNISQLSINIETDNKQNFFSLFFCVLDGEDPHFMC